MHGGRDSKIHLEKETIKNTILKVQDISNSHSCEKFKWENMYMYFIVCKGRPMALITQGTWLTEGQGQEGNFSFYTLLFFQDFEPCQCVTWTW